MVLEVITAQRQRYPWYSIIFVFRLKQDTPRCWFFLKLPQPLIPSPLRLVERLREIGIGGTDLKLLTSFLSDRAQIVKMGQFHSALNHLLCGVPQGSSLSQTLFNIYVAPLARIVRSFGLEVLSYADNMHITVSITHSIRESATNFKNCMQAVSSWMVENYLKLKGEKNRGPDHWKPTEYLVKRLVARYAWLRSLSCIPG